MAGFRITYDGSLLGRSDVPQVASTESLSSSTLVSPSVGTGFEGDSTISAVVSADSGVEYQLNPATWAISQSTAITVVQSAVGGLLRMTAPHNFLDLAAAVVIHSPLMTGTFNYEVRYQVPSVNPNTALNIRAISPNDSSTWTVPQLPIFINGQSGGAANQFFIVSGTAVLSNRSLAFSFSGFMDHSIHEIANIDYIRVTQDTSVTIADTTFTAGVAPTGGTGVVDSVSETTKGSAGVVGPTSPITVITDDGAQEAAKVLVEPPAENAENSGVDTNNTKIITATTTSLATSVSGLDATNKIASVETSLSVVALEDATEN